MAKGWWLILKSKILSLFYRDVYNKLKMKTMSIFALPLVQNTIKLSASSILLIILPLIVTPILSRLYTPYDYGDWGMFTSALYIITPLLFGSYEFAIVKASSKIEFANIVALCILFGSCIILLTVLVFLIGNILSISFFCKFPSLPLFIALLVISVVHIISNQIANREEKYGYMSISNIINGGAQASIRIIIGVFPILSYGLIYGNVLANLLSTLFILYCIKDIFTNKFFSLITLDNIKKVARDNIRFPKYDSPARFIEYAMTSFPLIVLSIFWGKEEIGCFSMITQLVLLPISAIGAAVGQVYYKEVSSCVGDNVRVREITIRVAKIMMTLSLLPVFFLTLGGDKFVVWFLGDQWTNSGKMALCLVIFSIPTIVSEPLLPIFRALNCQDIRFHLNMLNIFLSIGALLVVPLFTNNIFIAILFYAFFYAFVRFTMLYKIGQVIGFSVFRISNRYNILCFIAYSLLVLRIVCVLN